MNIKSIGKAWQEIYTFNDLAGNLNVVDAESINNQISFIFSELEETIEAFEEQDAVEVLDGACDLFVTVVGLMQKLEVAGFNVQEALKRVNENNNSKFVPVGDVLQYAHGFTATLNEKHQRFVIKDGNDKVRKHANFKEVDISDCVPDFPFGKEA